MKSLSLRLTLWYALVVTLTVGVTFLLGRVFLEGYLMQGMDLMLEAEFEEIRGRLDAQMETSQESQLLEAILEHAEIDDALYYFQINRAGGQTVFRSANLGGNDLPVRHGQAWVTIEDPELGKLRTAEFSHNGLDIHIAASLENIEMLFASYHRYSIYACLAVLVLSLGLGFFLSRIALNPIRAIQASARKISASNFAQRIHVPDTRDEIARMAELLNDMLDRLETAYMQVRRFTAEASHEFRTPLSIIRLQTERLLSDEHMGVKERQSALSEQMEEVERLNKLIDDLLILAKADAGVISLNLKSVDLGVFINDFQEDARLLAEEAGIRFEAQLDGIDAWVFDPSWIRRVLLNLLSNAIKASLQGSTIRLELFKKDECLHIAMEDQGRGIPEDQLSQVFERFQQVDSNGDASGSGLGLAICQSIALRHKGSITASNRTGGGLRMEMSLPPGELKLSTD